MQSKLRCDETDVNKKKNVYVYMAIGNYLICWWSQNEFLKIQNSMGNQKRKLRCIHAISKYGPNGMPPINEVY